jgi:hypothetical protein
MVLRRVFSPTRDVVNTLIRREADGGRAGTSVYFLDVHDHLARAIDGVDVYRDMVATALTAQVSVASQRLNETMRTMTALATILMTMALVTGVYGMNVNATGVLLAPWGLQQHTKDRAGCAIPTPPRLAPVRRPATHPADSPPRCDRRRRRAQATAAGPAARCARR